VCWKGHGTHSRERELVLIVVVYCDKGAKYVELSVLIQEEEILECWSWGMFNCIPFLAWCSYWWGVTMSWNCGLWWSYWSSPDDIWKWRTMLEWYWQENQRICTETCPSATLSITNPTWTDPNVNPGLCSEVPVTNCLSHGTAYLFNRLFTYCSSVFKVINGGLLLGKHLARWWCQGPLNSLLRQKVNMRIQADLIRAFF
jgi:hypothetical protein